MQAAQGPDIMALWLQEMSFWLGIKPKVAHLLIREQSQGNSDKLYDLTDEDFANICNIRKPDGKNANETPD